MLCWLLQTAAEQATACQTGLANKKPYTMHADFDELLNKHNNTTIYAMNLQHIAYTLTSYKYSPPEAVEQQIAQDLGPAGR